MQLDDRDFFHMVKKTRLSNMPCAIAQSLDVVGEWWSLLVIREAFFGTRRFGDFEARLGIARNILTARLSKLTERGIMRRVPGRDGSKYLEYELTEMGQELGPVLIAISRWGNKWLRGKKVTTRDVMETMRHEREVRATDVRPARTAARRRRG
jgi:DNA-binding HxlR family transcriptional regulator